jgi:glycosyltransferase involved in cell wall biosynthesis
LPRHRKRVDFMNIMGKKISQLVITPSYPPMDSSVTLINAKITRALRKINVDTVVITVDPSDMYIGGQTNKATVTPNLEKIFGKDKRVYRFKTYEIGRRWIGWYRLILRSLFPFVFYSPDYHFIWVIMAAIHLTRIKRTESIDIIHSISSPRCSHVLGYIAKKIFHKPWICHLDDFWVDQIRWSPQSLGTYNRLNQMIEKLCFNNADVILSTSREILMLMSERYPSAITKKMVYIPPSFDPNDYPETTPQKNEKYLFTFLGFLYYGDSQMIRREPYAMFEALSYIKKHDPQKYIKIDFRLVGVDHEYWNSEAARYGVADTVHCTGWVDYLESMRIMKESSVLVHLGISGRLLNEDIFVSGKLFEYFGSGRLVLGLTTAKGPVANIIRQNDGIVCDGNDHRQIVAALLGIMESHTVSELHNRKRTSIAEKEYDVSVVAENYRELYKRLIDAA